MSRVSDPDRFFAAAVSIHPPASAWAAGFKAAILAALERAGAGGLTETEVADRLGLDRQAIMPAVLELVRAGHVVASETADDCDSRLVAVSEQVPKNEGRSSLD